MVVKQIVFGVADELGGGAGDGAVGYANPGNEFGHGWSPSLGRPAEWRGTPREEWRTVKSGDADAIRWPPSRAEAPASSKRLPRVELLRSHLPGKGGSKGRMDHF